MKTKIKASHGFFYDKLIVPNQDLSYSIVEDYIEQGMTLLDIGCGTGRLSFKLKDKCKRIDGVDLSERKIKIAENMLHMNPTPKLFFHHDDIFGFLKNNVTYDAAILTYVIHEIYEVDRVKLLRQISEKADKIIIADYLVPPHRCLMYFIIELAGFLAGKEHFRNYKSFFENNGLNGLVDKAGLIKKIEIKNSPLTTHFIVLNKKTMNI